MIAEIIATGDEIRTGALVDSNSAYIAGQLEAMGLRVGRHTTIGDDLQELAAAFRESAARAQAVLVTGGLGPTSDDRSAEAAALAAGQQLVFHPDAFAVTERFYQRRRRPMAPSNRKQALLPESARFIDNPLGTAAGFHLALGQSDFFFLPGVPGEMRRMLSDTVLPSLGDRLGSNLRAGLLQTLTSFGLPESMVGERMAGFEDAFPEFILGFRAKYPEIQVKLYGRGAAGDLDPRRLGEARDWVARRLGERLLAPAEITLEARVGQLLTRARATLAVAESCTGGLIAHKLTNVAGSSDYFLLSAVTYDNGAKEKLLGVSSEILTTHGAVHEVTAQAMAEGVRRLAGATYGLSTSGIAGPGGGSADKPVGLVCIGLASPRGATAGRFHFHYGRRRAHKSIFAAAALDMLRLELMGLSPKQAGGSLVSGPQSVKDKIASSPGGGPA